MQMGKLFLVNHMTIYTFHFGNGSRGIRLWEIWLITHIATSESLIDSPIVLNNYKDEPTIYNNVVTYGAFQSNGRLWWVPTQGFSWDKDNNCSSR